MVRSRILFAIASTMLALSLSADPLNLQDYEIVDLTHPYNAETVFWPSGGERFKLESQHFGETDAGFFYSANTFCLPEHGGTHLDAPIHFSREGMTAEKIPLESLIGPVVVIDVSEKAAVDRDYLVGPEDVLAFEEAHGPITAGTIVLVRTGWSRYWPDATAYLGHATDATQLHFPGFSAISAIRLVRHSKAAMIGIDTASIDHGPSTVFLVHRVIAEANVPALENLTNLQALPHRGAYLIALPMKIEGGSGGPTRVVALVPRGIPTNQ